MVPIEDIQKAEKTTLTHNLPLNSVTSISASFVLRGAKLMESHGLGSVSIELVLQVRVVSACVRERLALFTL